MKKVEIFLQGWMLPLAIVTGISLYLVYHFFPVFREAGPVLHRMTAEGQRAVIALLLFFQFVKISPHQVKLHRWYLWLLLLQILSFLGFSALTAFLPEGPGRILAECAMLCFICPTASAAGVITEKMGGDLAATVSYLVLINVAATFLIPTVIPLIRPSAEIGFWLYVWKIACKVFPVLILPCLLAWIIRYTTHKLQRILMRLSRYTFYIWGVGLTLAMVLSTRALLLSHPGWGAIVAIVAVSLASCALQFAAGRFLGRPDDAVTAGQTLGQKNTGFLIWLGYTYLTPVTSVAGGLYAIWQNLFNSWELYKKTKSGLRGKPPV